VFSLLSPPQAISGWLSSMRCSQVVPDLVTPVTMKLPVPASSPCSASVSDSSFTRSVSARDSIPCFAGVMVFSPSLLSALARAVYRARAAAELLRSGAQSADASSGR